MEVRPTMAQDAHAAYDEVASALTATSPATTGQMFGMPCLKINGKTFAGLYNEAMTFKLGGAAHAGALALPGARLFDPSGLGRPMKAWVELTVEHAARWLDYGRQALDFVAGRSDT